MDKVYIANFGEGNYEWPVCKERGTIATMNDIVAQKLWEEGDREGYISHRMKGKTVAGKAVTKGTAARWYNLMTNIVESVDDVWIHRDGDHLWWTESTDGRPSFEEKREPIGRSRDVIVCHKPCLPWSNKDRLGKPILWRNLHPKAKDFLSTEATMQQLSTDYADYARALISAESLESWHERKEWIQKDQDASIQYSKVTYADDKIIQRKNAVYRMFESAKNTTNNSNGQIATTKIKNKIIDFINDDAFKNYIEKLLIEQDETCALTGLPIEMDEKSGDKNFFASLDRIDSNGHYSAGNLQIVCRFANFWKNDGDNQEFIDLIDQVRNFAP